MARTVSTHSVSSGKRNRIRERWAQRAFSPVDLLNLWEPTGAWEEYRGLAYGEGPRQRLDVCLVTERKLRSSPATIPVGQPAGASRRLKSGHGGAQPLCPYVEFGLNGEPLNRPYSGCSSNRLGKAMALTIPVSKKESLNLQT